MSVSGHGERTGASGLDAVGIKRKNLSELGPGGDGGEENKARSEGAGEEETFLIGQRLAQLHFRQRMWSLPSSCHFLQELPSTHYFILSSKSHQHILSPLRVFRLISDY